MILVSIVIILSQQLSRFIVSMDLREAYEKLPYMFIMEIAFSERILIYALRTDLPMLTV